jgi:hypothetical protein
MQGMKAALLTITRKQYPQASGLYPSRTSTPVGEKNLVEDKMNMEITVNNPR